MTLPGAIASADVTTAHRAPVEASGVAAQPTGNEYAICIVVAESTAVPKGCASVI
jgi:hypothetical protein